MAPIDAKQALADVFLTLAEELKEKHAFTTQELKELLSQEEIPATAFNNNLTPLQTLTLHYDQQQLTNTLNRPKNTLKQARKKAKKKHPQKPTPKPTTHKIPLHLFGDRTLAPLEHICTHLHQQGLTNNEIAKLTGRNPRTVWTALNRAKKKLAGDTQ